MDENLRISPFGTISGDTLDEINIDKFFKKIEKGINRCSKFHVHNAFGVALCYDAEVYKLEKHNYKICLLNDDKTNYKEYFINIENSIHYTFQLNEFARITQDHKYEKECYNKVENNERCSAKEKKTYLTYLKKVSLVSGLYSLKKILSLFSGPAATFLAIISATHHVWVGVSVFTLLAIELNVKASNSLFDTETYYIDGKRYTSMTGLIEAFKLRRLLKKRIKSMSNKLPKEREDVIADAANNPEDIYKNAVINYMNSIMKAADKLNADDKMRILSELKVTLEDYTCKCQAINNGTSSVLSLDNKQQVTKDTLDKLTKLEMEIADLVNRDNKNKELFSENEKLMQEIDNEIEESKKLTLTRGR